MLTKAEREGMREMVNGGEVLTTPMAIRLLHALDVKDGVLEDAAAHLDELRDAWASGALADRDGKGGTRSNQNVDVLIAVREQLK